VGLMSGTVMTLDSASSTVSGYTHPAMATDGSGIVFQTVSKLYPNWIACSLSTINKISLAGLGWLKK
jgi:hypothetical protein